jgi:O-antigen ligase
LKNISQIVFYAAFLLIAVFRFPSTDMRVSYQVLAEAGAMLVLCALIWRINPWVALFGVLAVFSTHFPGYTKASYYAGAAVMVGLVWYYAAFQLGGVGHILDSMLIIAMANLLFIFLQVANLDPIFAPINEGSKSYVGLMSNRNETAAIMAFCLPAAFRPKRWYFIIPIVVGLFLAKSCGGAVAAVFASVVFVLVCAKGLHGVYALAPVLVLAVAYLWADGPSVNARWDIWLRGFDIYKDHPIFGWGIGHWKMVYNVGVDRVVMAAHNDVLQGVFESGIPFAIILCGYGVNIIRKIRRGVAVAAAGVAAVVANALVNFPFHIATTAIIAVTWLAVFEIQLKETENAR